MEALHPYAGNPRRNRKAVAGVAESIRRYGFVNPIVLDEAGTIVCGHTRLLAAQKLGMREVPCVCASGLTDEEIRAYRLADNKVAELAEWDAGKLNAELSGLSEDMTVFGFAQPHESGIYQDDVRHIWGGKLPHHGDLWLLGRHRLYVGEASDTAMNALLDGQQADMMLSSAPNGKQREALAAELFASAQTLKAGASFYLWHDEASAFDLRGACLDAGMQVRQCLVWDAENGMPDMDGEYRQAHKSCLYGWMDGAPHLWASDRKQSTVIPAEPAPDSGSMPVALMAYCMENNTKGMDVVLDAWSRHGTTLIAAEQTGRIARVACECEDAAAHILARYAALTGDAQSVRCANV